MKRRRRIAATACALSLSSLAAAGASRAQPQPAATGAQRAQSSLPPGHHPVDESTDKNPAQGEQLPPGHPPVSPTEAAAPAGTETEQLPPGHPPTTDTEAQEAQAADMRSEPPADRVDGAPDLPAGTIEVFVRDERNLPSPKQPIELTIFRQDIAEGDSRERRSAVTDAEGHTVFGSLPHSSDYSFRVAAPRGPAVFATDMFQLSSGAQRVTLHTYPSTSDIRQALVGLRGIVVVQPRDDVFRFEANYEIFNIGRIAWVPDGWTLPLPDGAKAFEAAEGETRFEKKDDSRLRLSGTFGPGRHQVTYSYQLDNTHDTERSFRVWLPPHIAELRVVAEAAKNMKLEVEGFPEPQQVRSQNGSWLLVTGRQLARGDSPLTSLTLTVSGLPTPSPGRWYAVAIAVGLMGCGLWFGLRGKEQPRGGASAKTDDTKTARRLLLDELVLLERLHTEQQIGPRTYEASRSALIDALARIELT